MRAKRRIFARGRFFEKVSRVLLQLQQPFSAGPLNRGICIRQEKQLFGLAL
jgi:hypothetical protein